MQVLEASKNDYNCWISLQLMCLQLTKICWEYSASCFIYGFAFQVISEKILSSKEAFLFESKCNYNFCKFSYKFACIPLFSFRKNQQQELIFQQVSGLVTKEKYFFCIQWVALYVKVIPNSIDFCKGVSYMLFLFVSFFITDISAFKESHVLGINGIFSLIIL